MKKILSVSVFVLVLLLLLNVIALESLITKKGKKEENSIINNQSITKIANAAEVKKQFNASIYVKVGEIIDIVVKPQENVMDASYNQKLSESLSKMKDDGIESLAYYYINKDMHLTFKCNKAGNYKISSALLKNDIYIQAYNPDKKVKINTDNFDD